MSSFLSIKVVGGITISAHKDKSLSYLINHLPVSPSIESKFRFIIIFREEVRESQEFQ